MKEKFSIDENRFCINFDICIKTKLIIYQDNDDKYRITIFLLIYSF